MPPHSSTLAWKISWTEEPGRLQSMGWLRVGHDWATSCGYKENYRGLSQLDCLSNLCAIYYNLDSLITYSYLINSDKTYEIFTSLSDTQKVCINPLSSCTISGITLNYHSKHINPNNANHLSFVNLMEDSCSEYFIDCYLKGLTNNNNNFNFNF